MDISNFARLWLSMNYWNNWKLQNFTGNRKTFTELFIQMQKLDRFKVARDFYMSLCFSGTYNFDSLIWCENVISWLGLNPSELFLYNVIGVLSKVINFKL